jgi:hypothetical protein
LGFWFENMPSANTVVGAKHLASINDAVFGNQSHETVVNNDNYIPMYVYMSVHVEIKFVIVYLLKLYKDLLCLACRIIAFKAC